MNVTLSLVDAMMLNDSGSQSRQGGNAPTLKMQRTIGASGFDPRLPQQINRAPSSEGGSAKAVG